MGEGAVRRSKDSQKEKFLVRFGRRGFSEEDYEKIFSKKQNGVIMLNRSSRKLNSAIKTYSRGKKVEFENPRC